MPTSNDNIYVRIQQAYKAISAKGFTKDGTVKGAASYKYISIGQILEAVRKAQADAGITVVFGRPEYDHDNHEKRWEYTKDSGPYGKTTWYAAVGHITVRLFGKDADDCIETELPFEAQDNSDKLTNKIITNVERTLYRTLYSIDEGSDEDPEAYNVPMVPEKPAKADPFFGEPKKEAPKKAPAVDRPRETKVETICKMNSDPAVRPIIKRFAQQYGDDIDAWTDAQVDETYVAVINAGRAVE